jgi:hypothetical protein
MTRGILVAGNESALFQALGNEAAGRVDCYAASPIVPAGEKPATVLSEVVELGKADPRFTIDWNPASPVSARTVILAANNKLDHIDNAILVCSPPAYRKPPEGIRGAEIDRLLDNNIKGWYFLTREITAAFRKRDSGCLALVLLDPGSGSKEDAPDLAGPAIAAAFRAFSQSLLQTSARAPYTVTGFFSNDAGEESGFASYVFKSIDEGARNAGKWLKYGKLGIFGR